MKMHSERIGNVNYGHMQFEFLRENVGQSKTILQDELIYILVLFNKQSGILCRSGMFCA